MKPEELLHMFSEELYIMDRNAERLMVTELEETVAAKDSIIAEKDKALKNKKAASRSSISGMSLYL